MRLLRQLLHRVPVDDPERPRRRALHLGGRQGVERAHAPKFSKLAIPFLPNNPPRWPEVVAAVKKIVEVYARHAQPFERLGEWIERIGWPRFFKLAGIEFTRYHIDDFTHAGDSFARSAHVRPRTRVHR